MRFYSLGQLSQNEKSNILDKHKSVYDGYRKVWEPVSNEQPLYTQDFANDKTGVQVDNYGNVSSYNNKVYMREQVEEVDLEEEQHLDVVQDIDPDAEFDYIEPKEVDFTEFESAYSDELEEEIGGPLYSHVDPAYSFISKGPMREEDIEEMYYDTSDWDKMDYEPKGMEDYEDIEDEEEYASTFDRLRRGQEPEDIEYEELDDEIKEKLDLQKDKINEMFLRFSKYN